MQSLRELALALSKRQVSSTELTQHYLNNIAHASHLNAFISIDEEGALCAAQRADERLKKQQVSVLTGIPMAHKDIFCTTRGPTTCGSRMLQHFKAPYSATLVQHLENEGTVLLGKTNMDEFAMGSANENSYFGPVKNPWNENHVPGGSSGGSAAAVAANLVPFATGSDTGGSIRQPAAFCGISGIKPTYGLISRFGMIAYASSLDQAGVLAHSADDLALVLQAIAKYDDKDSTSLSNPRPNYSNALATPVKTLRLGIPTCFLRKTIDSNIQQAISNALSLLEANGATLVEIDLTLHDLWTPCYYVIACAEASSNLARYDGVRFGHRAAHANTIQELIARSRSEGFGNEVKRRILTGTHVLSSGYYDAYYVKAQKVRRLIQDELQQAFAAVDIIVGPTTPSTAFPLGEKTVNPTERYLADVFTVAANLGGFPALSFPVGFSNGLPIGMQFMGPHFSEATLLSWTHHYQQLTDWHNKRPSVPGESL